jgi:hypothetical protein
MSNGSEKHASPQNSAETPQDIEIDHKISLVRGGPFYRAQKAIRLLDANRWNLGRRITLAIVVCWVPLVLITLFLNPHATKGLLSDYPVNVRMLIAIPILLGGQILMENVFRKIVRHIGEAGLLTPSDMERLDRTLVTLIRLRDSAIPEAIIALIIFFHVLTQIHSQLAIALPWAVTGTEASAHITPAGWYYCVVSQLFYQFLLFVSIWKWTLWTAFLFRLSKLDLQIVPTHPDKHGGLGFLGMSPTAIIPTTLVAAAAIGANWREQILRHGLHLINFKFPAIILLAIMLIVAFGPLLFFVPLLGKLRRQGILQYGILGQIHSMEFHKKWIEHREGHEEELLAAPEISALIDLSGSFVNVEGLQPFPLDKGAVVGLVLSIAIPMLPVVLAEIPFVEVLKGLLSAVK